MKKYLWLMMLPLWVGCANEEEGTIVQPLFDNGVNVLQGFIANGLTGEPVSGAVVWVEVGQHVLDATVVTEGDRAGTYTIYGIPSGTFPVIATLDGFMTFESNVTFSGTGSLRNGSNLTYMLGNIVLYPEGTVAQDLVVSVYDEDGVAVQPGADVVVSFDTGSTVDSIVDDELTSNILTFNNGLRYPDLMATTGDDGIATISGTDLVLGAQYEINVYNALDPDGYLLARADGSSGVKVTIGTNFNQISIYLNRLTGTPIALNVNNEDGELHSDLEITFSEPIELCSDASEHDWYNSAYSSTQPKVDDPVRTTLNAEGTVMNLKPNYEPGTDNSAEPLYVTFTGVVVKVIGTDDAGCTQLSSVKIRNTGSYVDTEIIVRR